MVVGTLAGRYSFAAAIALLALIYLVDIVTTLFLIPEKKASRWNDLARLAAPTLPTDLGVTSPALRSPESPPRIVIATTPQFVPQQLSRDPAGRAYST